MCHVLELYLLLQSFYGSLDFVWDFLLPSEQRQSTEGRVLELCMHKQLHCSRGIVVCLLHYLSKEKDMALVQRKIMVAHVIDAVKLFFTMNPDVNMLSVTGVYIMYI